MNSNSRTSPVGLAVENVSVQYKINRGFRKIPVKAVQDCSFSIAKGGTLALIGESGSGKTTIANAILGLVPVSAGRISLNGKSLTAASSKKHPGFVTGLQVVMQDPLSSFNPRYKIVESLSMPLRVQGETDKDALTAKLHALAQKVGLSVDLLEKYPHQLSGGQLQRLSIARAVSVDPELIIADEPASKLDVSVRAQVLNLLKDILAETNASLLLITHDLDVAKFLCDDVVIMRLGEMIEQGRLRDVFASPAHSYTRTLISSSGTYEEM